MLTFYSLSSGRENVPSETPIELSLQDALEVYRNLDEQHGSMGIRPHGAVDLNLIRQTGGTRVELLDSSIPAFGLADNVDADVIEQLITAASNGLDVFQLARELIQCWVCLDRIPAASARSTSDLRMSLMRSITYEEIEAFVEQYAANSGGSLDLKTRAVIRAGMQHMAGLEVVVRCIECGEVLRVKNRGPLEGLDHVFGISCPNGCFNDTFGSLGGTWEVKGP